jgi:hypothetical protein
LELTTAGHLLNGDPGMTFYATDTRRTWVCDGPVTGGTGSAWSCVSSGDGRPGIAGSQMLIQKLLTGLADNVATNLCLITIPNAINACIVGLDILGALGDGDSAEASINTVAISRVAGAAAIINLSTKSVTAQTTGASGNAAITLSNVAVAGANNAQQTFQLQAKVARSGGVSTNHVLSACIYLINGFGPGGITIS